MKRVIRLLFPLLCLPCIAQVPVSPVINPHVTFVDASGSPCSGCKLYTYAAGTTTALATYTDAAGVSVNTNPIILDTAGGADIWLGANSYKFILKDASSTTIWSVDQVSAGWIQGIPAGGQTIIQPDGTTLGVNSLNGVLNASLFPGSDIGAKVNAAYAALGATGGRIVIPAAATCYAFSTPIYFGIQSKNVILSGDGATCIKYTATAGTAITFDTAGTIPHVTSTGIRDLILMGSGGEFIPSTGTALGIQIGVSNGAEGFTLSGSRITGFSTGATFGNNTFNTLFSHDIFINNTQNMVYPDTLFNAGEHMVFDATSFANSTTANVAGCVTIHGTTGLSMIFTSANFDSCQLDLEATGSQQAHISMSNPYFEDPAGHSAAPMVLNNGGAYLTIDSPTFYSDSSFPAYPITVAGAGGTYVHGIRIFGTGATAAVGVDSSHKAFIFGSVFDSENPSLPSYGYTGTASGTVTLVGDDDQTNQIFSTADPGLVVRSGPSGASDSAAAVSGQYFWSLLWSGVAQNYYPNGIASLGPHSLGFCYGDSGALPVANIHCDNTLTDGVMNTTAGYSVGGASSTVTAKKDISSDGTVVLATDTSGMPVLSGMYFINWEPGAGSVDRRQEIVAIVNASDGETSYLLAVPSNYDYLGNVVLSNLRVVGDTPGRRQLVVDVGNRNSTGTDSIRVTRVGDISYTPTLFPAATLGATTLNQFGVIQNPGGTISAPANAQVYLHNTNTQLNGLKILSGSGTLVSGSLSATFPTSMFANVPGCSATVVDGGQPAGTAEPTLFISAALATGLTINADSNTSTKSVSWTCIGN